MSIQAVAWALEQDLPARPKLVLVSIANHADHRTGYCWLKAETIGAEASCTPRAVFNFVGDLIRNGYIRKEPRKGDDGKQRASDYWILFDRAAVDWNGERSTAATEDQEGDGAAPADGAADTTTDSEPHERRACGENITNDAPPPVDKPAGSSGPHEHTCIRKESLDEPSKTNPKKDVAPDFSAAPRSYRPPPLAPEGPQGVLHPDASKPIFVIKGTRAWDAWMAHKLKTTGQRYDDLTCTLIIDGQKKSGWHFPTLFPPSERQTAKESTEKEPSTGPPAAT